MRSSGRPVERLRERRQGAACPADGDLPRRRVLRRRGAGDRRGARAPRVRGRAFPRTRPAAASRRSTRRLAGRPQRRAPLRCASSTTRRRWWSPRARARAWCPRRAVAVRGGRARSAGSRGARAADLGAGRFHGARAGRGALAGAPRDARSRFTARATRAARRTPKAALTLLRSIDGVEVVEFGEGEQCCGFGGTFSVGFPAHLARDGDAQDRARAGDGAGRAGLGRLELPDAHRRAWPTGLGRQLRTLHLAQVLRDALRGAARRSGVSRRERARRSLRRRPERGAPRGGAPGEQGRAREAHRGAVPGLRRSRRAARAWPARSSSTRSITSTSTSRARRRAWRRTAPRFTSRPTPRRPPDQVLGILQRARRQAGGQGQEHGRPRRSSSGAFLERNGDRVAGDRPRRVHRADRRRPPEPHRQADHPQGPARDRAQPSRGTASAPTTTRPR